MSANSSPKWRIGLLFTTLVMGIFLLTSGISGYMAATDNARTITESEIMSMFMGLRYEFRRAQNNPGKLLPEIFEDLQKRGCNYLALVTRNGSVVVEKGLLEKPFDQNQFKTQFNEQFNEQRRRQPVQIKFFNNGQLAHAMVRIPSIKGPNRIRRPNHKPRRLFMIIEIDSIQSNAVVKRAFWAMIIEIGSAIILLVAALIFWRLSRRSEFISDQMEQERKQFAAQLERDQQLKMLGQMSAILGHELNNPITALKGNAQLLVENLETDNSKTDNKTPNSAMRQAKIIIEEAQYLETLTTHVLDFAKTGSLLIEQVYLDDLAHAAITFSKSEPVKLTVLKDPLVWNLDRHRMEQVLINILRNARQASGDEPIDLIVDAQDELTIIIADNGSGIKSGNEQTVFEPFFTNRAMGSGLGLALSHRIIKEHGGTITAHNKRFSNDHCLSDAVANDKISDDKFSGAVFTLRLPVLKKTKKVKEMGQQKND